MKLDLSGSNMRAFDGRDLDLTDETGGSELRDCYLARADFSGADLRGCDFRGADLTRANLATADLTGAFFRGARLYEAKLPDPLPDADFRGAIMPDGTRFGTGIQTQQE